MYLGTRRIQWWIPRTNLWATTKINPTKLGKQFCFETTILKWKITHISSLIIIILSSLSPCVRWTTRSNKYQCYSRLSCSFYNASTRSWTVINTCWSKWWNCFSRIIDKFLLRRCGNWNVWFISNCVQQLIQPSPSTHRLERISLSNKCSLESSILKRPTNMTKQRYILLTFLLRY